MSKVRIIPCLDVNKGRVVKGINFMNLVDAGDPVEVAKKYCGAGADELVFLDITASTEGRDTTIDMVRRVSEVVTIPFTVGGGMRTIADMERVLNAGADKVSINTAAVKNKQLISEASMAFGSDKLVLAVDTRKINGVDHVVVSGGSEDAGLTVIDWVKECESLGAGEILLTSWDRDGTKSGFDDELLAKVTKAISIPVTASGGAGTMEHFVTAVLNGGASAVLGASVFHFGEININELKKYMASRGISIVGA